LDLWPAVVAGAGVFGLDAYEVRIARINTAPFALARMIAAPSGHYVEGSVASEAKLREWSLEIVAAFNQRS
jgi:hypothetical protein